MKFHERIEKESYQRHHADAGEEAEQDEKTSHSAEERSTARLPSFGGPFFILGPPWRFGAGMVGVGHWFKHVTPSVAKSLYHDKRDSSAATNAPSE